MDCKVLCFPRHSEVIRWNDKILPLGKDKTQKENTMKQLDDRSRRRFLKASSMLGLAVAFSPGTTDEAFADSQSKTIQKEDTMTQARLHNKAASRGLTRMRSVRFM
jgi:hypothetical protein